MEPLTVRDEHSRMVLEMRALDGSGRIGRDRLRARADTGADYVTSTDTSCLLHLDGLRRRNGFGPRPIHLAEILAAEEA